MENRIVIDPGICHGKPIIKGTRELVSNILSALASGESIEEVGCRRFSKYYQTECLYCFGLLQ